MNKQMNKCLKKKKGERKTDQMNRYREQIGSYQRTNWWRDE